MSVTIEQDLKDYLVRFENKLDKLGEDLNQKIDKLDSKTDGVAKELNSKIDDVAKELNSKIDNVAKEVNSKIDNVAKEVTDLKVSVARLEKTDGLSKRLETTEFVNRGIFVSLIIAILGGFAKLFGLIGNR
ncbi:hypothetical protein NIES593_20290 [Hydrococcus rivularis NIES-593]|uniref:Uncharacterized protein n=1 Tax=Hydrococcus rivularis NIES-593 TaxID=1921803 RepID=A0A1U7H8X8_9CYAN|nr:DUF1640 domain-containing protein [Hydrococcus rivularis]OKH19882.1 hypothetical protein NIES593_20290 [Hydrococcus rivularis NIES-593]